MDNRLTWLKRTPCNVAYEGGTEEAHTMWNDSMTMSLSESFWCLAADTSCVKGGIFYTGTQIQRVTISEVLVDIGWTVRQCLIWNKNTSCFGPSRLMRQAWTLLVWLKEGAVHYFCERPILDDYHWGRGRSKQNDSAELTEYIERMQANSPTTIINENKPARNGLHLVTKPLKLIERLVRNSSKKGWTC